MANAMTFGHRLEELTDGVTVFRNGVGKPMPLISTDFDIQISSGLAIVVATRKFVNSEDVPIEAILTMPVGFNAIVTGLSAQIDGRQLRAVAKPKTVARARYESAIDSGKMAVLHEEVLRGIHVLSVGQLAPGNEVSVELRTVLPLTSADTDPFLRIPVTTGQLYGATPLQPADDLITDRTVKHVASLRVRTDTGVAMLGGARAIEPGQTTEITLNKAIELVIVGGQFGSLIGTSAYGHQVRLDLRPTQGGSEPLKLAVLVDRSGSTNSTLADRTTTVLGAMKRGLADALTGLQEQDYIALWQFSDDCQRLGTGAGPEVLQLLKKLNQPRGGTSLAGAIRKVASTGVRDILMLTDGQTWDKLHPLVVGMNIRVSAVLVGKGSLDANIGHFCAMTGGDLYYAPDADVAPAVRLALQNNRTGVSEKRIALESGKPISVSRSIGGVDITANWSDAMEIGRGGDIGRFAAGICLSMVSETEAEELAVVEGLCSHLTSLVLVDEVGEKSDGLSETRKIPLMDEEDRGERISAMLDDDSQLGDFIEDKNAVLPLDSARPMMYRQAAPAPARPRFGIASLIDRSSDQADSEILRKSVGRDRIRQIEAAAIARGVKAPKVPARKLRSFLDDDWPSNEVDDTNRSIDAAELERFAQGIDWEGQTGRFSAGDFGGLIEEEQSLLAELVSLTSNLPLLRTEDADPRLVLLAYLALRFVTHSSAAKSLAAKVFSDAKAPLSEEIDGCLKSHSD